MLTNAFAIEDKSKILHINQLQLLCTLFLSVFNYLSVCFSYISYFLLMSASIFRFISVVSNTLQAVSKTNGKKFENQKSKLHEIEFLIGLSLHLLLLILLLIRLFTSLHCRLLVLLFIHLHFNSYLFEFRNKKSVFFLFIVIYFIFCVASSFFICIGTEHDLAVFMAIEQRENQSGDFAALQQPEHTIHEKIGSNCVWLSIFNDKSETAGKQASKK